MSDVSFFLPISFLWFPSFPRSPFLLFCSQGSCLVIFFPSLMKTNATKLINSFLFWRRQSSCSISWTTPCSFVISPFYFKMNDVKKKKKNGFIERAGKVTWLVAFFRGAVLCTRKKKLFKKIERKKNYLFNNTTTKNITSTRNEFFFLFSFHKRWLVTVWWRQFLVILQHSLFPVSFFILFLISFVWLISIALMPHQQPLSIFLFPPLLSL